MEEKNIHKGNKIKDGFRTAGQRYHNQLLSCVDGRGKNGTYFRNSSYLAGGGGWLIQLKHFLKLWLIYGQVYMTMEGIWRGWTHISMLVVGGLCGVIVGLLNQIPTKLKIWQQCVIGTTAILFLEFVSGCILNLWLHLGIWDYNNVGVCVYGHYVPLNFYGQICIPYAVLWCFIVCPFAIWYDDRERHRLFGEGKPYPILENFIEFWQGK